MDDEACDEDTLYERSMSSVSLSKAGEGRL
jgi:hypothetical protein